MSNASCARDAILECFRVHAGGPLTASQVQAWIEERYPGRWKDITTPLADLAIGGNVSSTYPDADKCVRRVGHGLYRLDERFLQDTAAAQIEDVFASILERITNNDLRQKVVKTWLLACQRGGWNSVDELKAMPFTLLTKTHGINFIEHTIAVTEGAYGLAKAQEAAYKKLPYPVNYDRLLAGGLLHDVGKLVETEKDGQGGFRKSRSGACLRHPISGTALAYEAGIRDETILNTIACHAKEGEGAPKCLETVLIHQADFATFDPLVMMEKGSLIQ